LIRFLIRHTVTPAAGPKVKDAIKAGSSDKSILIKLGISGTLKLKNNSTVDTAASIATDVSFLVFVLFIFLPPKI
jgi:hypothetical protein